MDRDKISSNTISEEQGELERRVMQQALDLLDSERKLEDEIEKRKEITVVFDELNRRHESILHSAGEGIFGLDLCGNTTFINPSVLKMIGYDSWEIIGKDQHKILQHSKADGVPYTKEESPIWEVLKSGVAHHILEGVFWRKDGSSFPVEYICNPIIEGELVLGAVVTFKDITERKNFEKRLWVNEQRFRTISESSPVGIYQIDGDDFYIYVNTRWQMITQRSLKDSLGQNWWEIIYPEDQNLVFDHWAKCEKEKQSFSIDCRILRPNGEVVWCQINANFFYHDHGKTAIGTIEDITARRETQFELERSNQALNDFAAIASHDLQDPLRKVINFSERAEEIYTQNEEKARDYLKRMRKAAGRMQVFVQDLLKFSQVSAQAEPFETLDLQNVLDGVLEALEVRISQCKGTVHIGNLPTLMGDPFQIHQVFQNLIGNALKFYRKDVPPVIQVSSTKLSGDRWEIKVEDNGIGFDEKKLDRILRPFERLEGRSAYEGSGMGLAICNKIMIRHGGTITATSVPQEGSTFVITFPEKQKKSN